MIISEMITLLSTVPHNAEIICGESPFTMWIASDRGDGVVYLDMMFIGMKGDSPIHVSIDKLINSHRIL